MGRVSRVVGKMPFAGKPIVENAAMTAICERTSLREKARKSASAAGFLTVFAAVHGVQAKLGINELQVDIPELTDGSVTSMDLLEATVSTAYTLANAAVTYTQLEIAGRVGINYLNFRRRINDGGELADTDRQFPPSDTSLTAVAVTLAGQAAFIALRD